MAGSILKDVLAAFSPRGDQFAITTGDGRVKTWDVASGHVCAEFNAITADGPSVLNSGGHLDLNYKTLAWGAIPSAKSKKSKKKGSLISLGTGGGDVLAWDPVLGELKWRANDCNPGGVRTVCFVKGQESLYSSGMDGMVCELDVGSGQILSKFRASKSAVTSIALSQDGTSLLAAASELRLFDMATKKRIRKFTGHASSVTASVFSGDGKYALSAAESERHVAIWDCEASGKGATKVLAMEHPAVALDTYGFGKDGKPLKVLAISEAGEAYVWSGENLEELGKATPVRISVSSSNTGKYSKESIILGRLLGDSLLVARGATVKPSFETLNLAGHDSNVILPPSQPGNLLEPRSDMKNNKSAENEVTVLGADNAADASLIKPQIEAVDVKKRKRRAVKLAENVETTQDPEGNKDEDVPMEENEEMTMEERLMALGIVEKRPEDGNASENAHVVPPKSDSLNVLLRQAVQSDDNNLLEQCLHVYDEKVISNTIRSLPAVDACKLLRLAITKLEARPRRSLQLVVWIRAVLVEHATYIMSQNSLQPVLRTLHQIIESRLYIFRPLLSLSGRLDLIMAKIKASEKSRTSEDTEVVAVYEEEDSEQEVEDAMEDDEDDEDEEEDGDEADPMQEDKPLENGGNFSDDESQDE